MIFSFFFRASAMVVPPSLSVKPHYDRLQPDARADAAERVVVAKWPSRSGQGRGP
jgi:hypothetical protein